MSNGLKKTIRYSLIVIALVIVALLVAPFFIDVNQYKDVIEQKVEDATGRKLAIGDISASLFPWIGVKLDNVHLSNRKGFADRDFASMESVDVRLNLIPLFSGRYEIKRFILDKPDIYLERHKDGETNWGDLTQPKPAAEGEATESKAEANKSSELLAALQADQIKLSDGSLTWDDAQGGNKVELTDLNVQVDDLQLKRPVGLKVSGKLGGDAFSLDSQVGPIGDIDKIEVTKLPVQGELSVEALHLKQLKGLLSGWPAMMGSIDNATASVSAKIEQRPDGLRMSEGSVQVKAAHQIDLQWKADMPSSEKMEIRQLQLGMDGKQLVRATGQVNQLSTEPTYELKANSDPIERTWLAGLLPSIKEMYAAHPSPWKQIQFGLIAAGSGKKVDIRDLQLKLDGEVLQSSGSLDFENAPNIRLRMAANTLHADPWLPQAQEEQGKGAAAGGAAAAKRANAAEPDLRFLEPWRVAVQFQAGQFHLRGLVLQNMRATINGANGKFNLNPLRFGLSGGQVEENASLNVAAYPAKWTESVHVSGVKVGPVLKTLADMDMFEGTLNMNTNLYGTGMTQKSVGTMGGKGNVLLRDGKIRGFDIAGAIRKVTNPLADTGPKETDFAQLSGSFTGSNGIFNNSDLFLANPLIRVNGNGNSTINLVNKTMDYRLKATIVGSLTGQGDKVQIRKGLSVPLHIYGPFASPKVVPQIDPKALIEGAISGGNVGGALGKILGGKQAAPAGQNGQQQQQPQTPQEKLKKGLGGLIPGL